MTITPRDIPEVLPDLGDWFGSPTALETMTSVAHAARHAQPGVTAAQHAARRVTSLKEAELYFVNADMTQLAIQVAGGLEEWFTTEDAPVDDHGLLIWETPLPVDDGPRGLWPTAAAWCRTGSTITVDTYGDFAALRQDATERGLYAKGYGPQLDQMRAGRLAFLSSIPFPAHQKGAETTSIEVDTPPDIEGMLGILLATWLLIRQPADQRRALHQVEEVRAPRAGQKRIRRAGGDPLAPVRCITLRQSLRPTGYEPVEGHAGRVYRHRWFVKPHPVQQYYPSEGEHRRIWRGPYLVVPPGCEDAPILGGERVNVLRR